MNYRLPINTIKEQIEAKLQHNFGLTLENATDDQCYIRWSGNMMFNNCHVRVRKDRHVWILYR